MSEVTKSEETKKERDSKQDSEEIKIEPEEQKGVSEEEVKWAAGGTST